MSTSETNTPIGGLRGLLDALWRVHARNETAVLGVVIATEGSTYQKSGAMVLLDSKGLRHGVISGGCLEPALEDAARKAHESGLAAAVEFDTRSDEDLLFGSGIGCRGRVRLLLLPLPPQAPLARALFSALDQGNALQLAFAMGENDLGAGVAGFASESSFRTAAQWDREGRSNDAPVDPSLRFHIAMPPRLLLLGAGPETAPLASFSRRLGWFVEVVEHRGRWSTFAQHASIDRLIDLSPEAAAVALADERYDAMLVMSHNYTIDLTWLRFCAAAEASYVGLLGPAARRDALLAELDAQTRTLLHPRLHGPIGLDLGGHGGEAVALAITAQLQQHFSAPRRSDAPQSAARVDA